MGDSNNKKFGDKFVKKLGTQLNTKAPVFGESLFAGAGDATKNAWGAGTSFATGLNANGGFGTGQRAAMDSLGGVFSGYGGVADNNGLTDAQARAMTGNAGLGAKYAGLGNAYDPNSAAYKTLRQGIVDDTLSNLGSQFTNSGRFGGGSYIDTASQGLGDALAGLDYANMSRNIDNQYRSLDSQRGIFGDQFGMGQTGVGNTLAGLAGQAGVAGQQFDMGQTALGNQAGALDRLTQIGAAQDADAQGALLGRADLFDRTKNAELDRLIKIGAAFGDPVGAANEAPWWQQMLGYVVGNAGKAVGSGAFGG